MAKVAIVCAIPVEFKETRKFLKDVREVAHPEGSIYDQGTFESPGQNWDVLLVEAGAGNAAAAMATQRAIDFFKPDVVLFVGVAGGLKDVKRGDVVAASQVFQYDKGKAADEFMPRPNAGTANYALSERAKAESRKDDPDWIKRLDLKEPLSDPLPKLYVGDIVAGEKVVTSDKSETAQILAKHFSNALAVEMEGIGFYSAIRLCGNSQLPGLLIRGISDMVTDKAQSDEDGWQPKAARNAAAVAFDILSKTSVRTTAAAAVVHSISGELSELRQKLLKQEMVSVQCHSHPSWHHSRTASGRRARMAQTRDGRLHRRRSSGFGQKVHR
ncbi:MAG: 5'-methylthioadenosine/S-adenosylhomocysteine nucleosidase [Candidatus Obscuribacter sp.]|nr:5'-methylthioadenosine/S-adenosylhomocysteine nucleosidase [Candidatus Obscuribacter sp.]